MPRVTRIDEIDAFERRSRFRRLHRFGLVWDSVGIDLYYDYTMTTDASHYLTRAMGLLSDRLNATQDSLLAEILANCEADELGVAMRVLPMHRANTLLAPLDPSQLNAAIKLTAAGDEVLLRAIGRLNNRLDASSDEGKVPVTLRVLDVCMRFLTKRAGSDSGR